MAIDSRVSLIMTANVITVQPETVVEEVARLMCQHNISSVPVTDNGRLVGILTDYDLITRQSEYDAPMFIPFLDAYFQIPGSGHPEQLRRILATTARELMSSPVETISPSATVQDVATLMYEKHLNAVPVVDAANKVVGIVARQDVIRLMVSDEEQYLRAHPDQG